VELVAHNKRYKNFYKSNSAIDMSRSKLFRLLKCIQKFIINQKYKEYDKDYHDIDI